ncbi:MAG: patatin-like phospholipase family protein [Rhodobacter sp.]|nr:patatin-like phospholipase family protein [Rhodobacter sp.]
MTPDPTMIPALRRLDSLSGLSDAELAQIARDAEIRTLPRGTVLMRRGDQPDALYLVLRGRFVVLSDGRPIAEIGTGEPVGEIGFFAGTPRSATVVAARESAVLRLGRDKYDALIAQSPQLVQGILATLAARLGRSVAATPELQPRAGRVSVVIEAGGRGLDPVLARGLQAEFAARFDWQTIVVTQAEGLADAVARIEQDGQHVLLIVPDAQDDALTSAALAQADTVVMVRDARDAPGLTGLEHRILAETLPENLHLARWFVSGQSVTGGGAWLADRPVALHHNIRAGVAADIARLGRFLRGEATGLVMCGGGSFGTAHFGACKALQEAGIEIDMIGGTSIGSAIAGALAAGITPDDGIAMLEDMFLRKKAMSKYAFPRYSVLDHQVFDVELRRHLGTGDIEDLRVPFFAVATSLTEAARVTIRRGPLWQAVRASTSLPGIFQPFVTAEGHVWIDGGLMDNTPIGVMRSLKPGRNIVLGFPSTEPMTSARTYDRLPGRFEVMRSLVSGAPADAPPSLFAILADAMTITSRRALADIAPGEDVFVEVPLPRGMSFLDWTRGREAFDGAHRALRDRLDGAGTPTLAMLRG